MKLLLLCLCIFKLLYSANGNLETIRDEELMELIRSEKYVIVLFTRKYCDNCDNYEKELIGLREDLVESLNAWVVKVEDSQMTRLYSPDKEPALVFFRHGVPLLYDGPLNDEYIMHTFNNNKEPITKELTDDTFEHLTQAASGATTGDWFVMFYTTDCVDCQRLTARWEALGAHVKSRVNVARVNKATTGGKTARRFNVGHVPAFILFKKGKMYRYEIQKYEISAFLAFVQEFYVNVRAEPVPVPKTPFDDVVAMAAEYLKENPWLWQVGFGTFLVGLVASLGLKVLARSQQGGESKKRKAEKKSKSKKEKNT